MDSNKVSNSYVCEGNAVIFYSKVDILVMLGYPIQHFNSIIIL